MVCVRRRTFCGHLEGRFSSPCIHGQISSCTGLLSPSRSSGQPQSLLHGLLRGSKLNSGSAATGSAHGVRHTARSLSAAPRGTGMLINQMQRPNGSESWRKVWDLELDRLGLRMGHADVVRGPRRSVRQEPRCSTDTECRPRHTASGQWHAGVRMKRGDREEGWKSPGWGGLPGPPFYQNVLSALLPCPLRNETFKNWGQEQVPDNESFRIFQVMTGPPETSWRINPGPVLPWSSDPGGRKAETWPGL